MAGGRWLENLGLKRKRGLGRVFPFSVKTVSVKHQTQPSQPPELTYIRDQVCLSVCASLSVSLSVSRPRNRRKEPEVSAQQKRVLRRNVPLHPPPPASPPGWSWSRPRPSGAHRGHKTMKETERRRKGEQEEERRKGHFR